MKRTKWVSVLLVSLFVGVSSCRKPAPIIIGHVEHRNGVVTIKSSVDGTLYSAKDNEGNLLFENLTAKQLKVRSPKIYELIDPTKAGSADLILPKLSKPSILR